MHNKCNIKKNVAQKLKKAKQIHPARIFNYEN